MRVLISGATGLIGGALARTLVAQGNECWGLSRRARQPDATFARWFAWDTLGQPLPAEALEGVDAVVHLAGEPVGEGRWNDEKKKRIRDSRVEGTRAMVNAMRASSQRPAVFVSASATGFYGDRGDELLREDAPPGSTFLAEVCTAWEHASAPAAELGIRLVQPRIGIVLAREGGMFPKAVLPFKLGLGGRLGPGTQYFPWIHIDDVVGILQFALANVALHGPVNLVAPHPVTNRELTETLARTLHRPAFMAVPQFALDVMLGELGKATVESVRASAEKITGLGYAFSHPVLGPALLSLVG